MSASNREPPPEDAFESARPAGSELSSLRTNRFDMELILHECFPNGKSLMSFHRFLLFLIFCWASLFHEDEGLLKNGGKPEP